MPADEGGWRAPLVGQVAGGDGTNDTVTNNKICKQIFFCKGLMLTKIQ